LLTDPAIHLGAVVRATSEPVKKCPADIFSANYSGKKSACIFVDSIQQIGTPDGFATPR